VPIEYSCRLGLVVVIRCTGSRWERLLKKKKKGASPRALVQSEIALLLLLLHARMGRECGCQVSLHSAQERSVHFFLVDSLPQPNFCSPMRRERKSTRWTI
jgi:hypothetical protein